jgi:hypothetical protein
MIPTFPATLDAETGVGLMAPSNNAPQSPFYPPLETVTKPTVDTAAAAYYVNRKQQTLRAWACLENGPIRPIHINGRLAWSVATLRQLLKV